MDFHAAMETFAEAWVAANVHTAVNTDPGQINKQSQNMEDQTTNVSKDHPKVIANHQQPPTSQPTSPTAGAKSLPIHCVVEQTSGAVSFDDDGSSHYTVELDSYAILPCTTLFSELVRAALVKLGYNSTESMNAKGAIQIKNWRPLTFDAISNNSKSTVEDILGELTQVAKLRIRLCSLPGITSPDTWNDHTVRCAVLSLLKEMGQTALAKLCPLTQSAISNIANWKYNNKLSDEKCAEFGKWYTQYMSNTTDFPCDFGIAPKDSRLTFHPDHEIPEMRQWYKTCKNPTEHKLNAFANELNKGHVRQERPKVTIAKLKIWWKNERQREKKLNKSVKTATVTSPCSLHNVNTEHKLNASSQDSIDLVQQSFDLANDGSETFQKSHDQIEEPIELLKQLRQSDDVTKDGNQTERKSYVTLQTTRENSLNINPIISIVPGMSEMNNNQNRRMENISESSIK